MAINATIKFDIADSIRAWGELNLLSQITAIIILGAFFLLRAVSKGIIEKQKTKHFGYSVGHYKEKEKHDIDK